MKFTNKRAVSPIIASLLLIAIAVAAGIIVYVYVNSLAGGLTSGGGQQVATQLQMQAYSFNIASGNNQIVVATLKNTGSSSLAISAVYVDGVSLNEWGTGTAGTYDLQLLVPGTAGANAPGCFALVPAGTYIVYNHGAVVTGAGTTNNCNSAAGTDCNAAGVSFCLDTDTVYGTPATQSETGGVTGTALAAQSSTELVIGANGASCSGTAFPGCPAIAGTSHTIKIVTSTGAVATFSIVAGRSG